MCRSITTKRMAGYALDAARLLVALDARRGNKSEVRFPVLPQLFGQVLACFASGTRVVATAITSSRAASSALARPLEVAI